MNYSEKDLVPYETSVLPEGPWLVFAPHPDDETFGMGGAIILAAQNRINVYVDIVTDGRMGGDGSDLLVQSRQQEAKQACSMLGVKECQFWEVLDRSVKVSSGLVDTVCQRINEVNPAAIFFPSPFEYHPDHRTVANLVWKGVEQCGFAGRVFSYEITRQGESNFLLDISKVFERKAEVMKAYRTQLKENNYADVVQALDQSRSYTLPNTVSAAEGFFEYSIGTGETLASQILRSVRPYWIAAEEMEPPLVSVIVRTFNRPRLLVEAIQSIANQTYPRIEVVVVNDGGEDVGDVVNHFAGQLEKMEYVPLVENQGRSAAANAGLEVATGKYLSFLDDDDLLEPSHIEQLMDMLAQYPGVHVAYSSVRQINENGSLREELFETEFDPIRLLAGNYIPIHAVLFHRSLFDHGVRMDEHLDLYEDWDFMLQLSQHGLFVHNCNPSALYRIGGSSDVGLNPNLVQTSIASRKIHTKWRNIWSMEQVNGLIDRVHRSYVLENQLHELQGELKVLQGELKVLQGELKVLQGEHEVLQSEHEVLQSEHEVLQSEHEVLQSEHEVLQSEHEVLQNEHEVLQDRYEALQHMYNQVHFSNELLIQSTSWRVTKPLRGLKYLYRSKKAACKKSYEHVLDYIDFGRTNSGKILSVSGDISRSNSVICVFSHYDKEGFIDDYVLFYLDGLKKVGVDIVFVTTSSLLGEKSLEKIMPLCDVVIHKENIGYDFGAWKSGLELIGSKIGHYDELILCNDSVYAPLVDFNSMFAVMRSKGVDYWGITDSLEMGYHLQSYFIVYSKKVFQSECFAHIFLEYKAYVRKSNIINKYETKLTRCLGDKGYTCGVYCSFSDVGASTPRNITHFDWKALITECHCPIIKIELLRDNPVHIDISDWEDTLSNFTDYKINLINNHLSRIKHDSNSNRNNI